MVRQTAPVLLYEVEFSTAFERRRRIEFPRESTIFTRESCASKQYFLARDMRRKAVPKIANEVGPEAAERAL
jgi:hypothetical protein